MKKTNFKTPNTKNKNGITLVALIITIVVLLILAIVSIGAISDSNLIAHAENASSMYNVKQEEEKGTLEDYESKIEEVLGKDRVYSNSMIMFEGITFTIMSDNKILVPGEEPIPFKYIDLDEEVIKKYNDLCVSGGYSGLPSMNLEDYSSAICFIGEDYDEGIPYLILSKDMKILYYIGIPFYLEGEEPEKKYTKAYTGILDGGGEDSYIKNIILVPDTFDKDWMMDEVILAVETKNSDGEKSIGAGKTMIEACDAISFNRS